MSESTVRTERSEPLRLGSGGAQWYGIVVPAVAMLANVGLGYALVPWSCAGKSHWALHVMAIVLLVIAISGAVVGMRQWREGGGNASGPSAGGELRDALARARFMGALGMASGVLFGVAIITQWLATVFISPCWGA
jgi:hypothetical protein